MIVRALVVVLAVVLANTAGAQERQRCTITSQANQLNVKLPSGQYNSFFGGPVVVVCPAKDLTLHSDSLESYPDEGRIYVHDPRFHLAESRGHVAQNDHAVQVFEFHIGVRIKLSDIAKRRGAKQPVGNRVR